MAGVEFQVFEGVSCDLRPWISKLEDQFACDDYSDMNKLALAVYLLGGKAESFVHQREEIKYFETWDELKSSLIRMFGERDDPERIRLQTERDVSTHNWLVALKVRKADVIQEMTMPNPAVSESQVQSLSVSAIHIRDESDLTTKMESTGLTLDVDVNSEDPEQIESLVNEVPISLLEPCHRIGRLEYVFLENKSLQLHGDFDKLRVDEWKSPRVEHTYVLDVDMGEELIQKSADAEAELVAHHLFDLLLQRVGCKRKQPRCHKNWKFKYKMEDLGRFLPQNDHYTSMRVKHQTSNSLCASDHVGSLEKMSTCGRWRSQQQSWFFSSEAHVEKKIVPFSDLGKNLVQYQSDPTCPYPPILIDTVMVKVAESLAHWSKQKCSWLLFKLRLMFPLQCEKLKAAWEEESGTKQSYRGNESELLLFGNSIIPVRWFCQKGDYRMVGDHIYNEEVVVSVVTVMTETSVPMIVIMARDDNTFDAEQPILNKTVVLRTDHTHLYLEQIILDCRSKCLRLHDGNWERRFCKNWMFKFKVIATLRNNNTRPVTQPVCTRG
ncbi:hypothetical protein YC2023_065561 [Brassica napus]|uniref:Uncharacterized protein n=3 Tax=Brassica TaxID=3705 RepID=M4DZX3_BRACM